LFLPWLHGHVVVCGTGSKGSRLAEEALERGLRVVVVEIDADNPNLGPLRRDGATVIAGDARDDDVLREAGVARAGVVIACTRRDGDNIEVAGLVCRLVNTERPRRMHPRASRVRCFAHVADAELVTCALCDPTLTRPDDDFELRLFSRHDVAARMLATDHLSRALASPATCARQVHVVLAGLGRTGEAVACAALEFPHAPIGAPLHLTVVDRDAAVRVESFVRRRRLTRAENGVRDLCTIEARPLVVVDPRAFTRELEAIHGRRPVDAVVVWLEDDTLAVECGLDARPWAIEHGVPVFVRARRGAGVATLLRGDGAALRNGLAPVTAFGQDEETCGWDVVVGERLDELGRAIHEGYLSTVGASGDPGQQWHALPEVDARSNLGQADHIPFKLAALGLRIAPGTSPADACPFTDAEIEFLARLEHDRWVADRLLLGFRLPRAGESKDKVRRIHPDLVPWEDLSEAARRKDQDPVRAIASLLRRLRVHAVRDGG
jgi:voltage-gated potassium channel Kch